MISTGRKWCRNRDKTGFWFGVEVNKTNQRVEQGQKKQYSCPLQTAMQKKAAVLRGFVMAAISFYLHDILFSMLFPHALGQDC